MNISTQKMIASLLRDTADKFDAGNTNVTEEQALDMMAVFSHKQLSKDQACTYLNLSRSRFDDLVRQGKIPRGKKIRGFKELVWWEDELYLCKK